MSTKNETLTGLDGSNILSKNKALVWACRNNMNAVALRLIEHKSNGAPCVDRDEYVALVWACKNNMIDVILKLIETCVLDHGNNSSPIVCKNAKDGYNMLINICKTDIERVLKLMKSRQSEIKSTQSEMKSTQSEMKSTQSEMKFTNVDTDSSIYFACINNMRHVVDSRDIVSCPYLLSEIMHFIVTVLDNLSSIDIENDTYASYTLMYNTLLKNIIKPWNTINNLPNKCHNVGWTNENYFKLVDILAPNVNVWCELGSFYGKSALPCMLINKSLKMICIDVFLHDTLEVKNNPGLTDVDKTCIMRCLSDHNDSHVDAFMNNLYDFKDNVLPLKCTTIFGLNYMKTNNILPDVVYIDAGHEYEDVCNDIDLIVTLFKNAIICGDDYFMDSVRTAVNDRAKMYLYDIFVCQNNVTWIYANVDILNKFPQLTSFFACVN